MANEFTFADGSNQMPVKIIHEGNGNIQLTNLIDKCQSFCNSHSNHTGLEQIPHTSAYYGSTPSMVSYIKCIHSTSVEMLNQTTYYSLDLIMPEPNSFSFQLNKVQTITPSIINTSPNETFTINIICYEKNIRYLLKYISFIINAYDDETLPKITFICVCDNTSFNNYKDDIIELKQQTQVKTLTPMHKIHRHNFTQFLHGDGDTIDETDIWNIRKCNIYFASCTHVLSAGVGGKRALIQYINFESQTTYAATMDDNITGIYRKNQKCNYNLSMNNNDPMSPFNIQLFDTMLECGPVNIVWLILQQLVPHMRLNPECLMVGVDKGSGRSASAKNIQGSISLYKLNLTNPKLLRNNWYLYNPYFTRFAEDTTFNLVIKFKKQNFVFAGDFFLRFGHPTVTSSSSDGRDFEDFLPTTLTTTRSRAMSLVPVYCMYILYAKLHADANTLTTINTSEFTCGLNKVNLPSITLYDPPKDPWLTVPKKSKYGHYTFFVYNFALQLLNKENDTKLFEIGDSFKRQVFFMFQKLGLITILPKSDFISTIRYKWTYTADILIPELSMLPAYYHGNMAQIKQSMQLDNLTQIGNLVLKIRNDVKESDDSICHSIESIGRQKDFINTMRSFNSRSNPSLNTKKRSRTRSVKLQSISSISKSKSTKSKSKSTKSKSTKSKSPISKSSTNTPQPRTKRARRY